MTPTESPEHLHPGYFLMVEIPDPEEIRDLIYAELAQAPVRRADGRQSYPDLMAVLDTLRQVSKRFLIADEALVLTEHLQFVGRHWVLNNALGEIAVELASTCGVTR